MSARESHLRRTYGMSLEQYDQLRRQQKYLCGVCKRHESTFKIRLSVDHDHHTGEVRGLLCTHCNRYVIGKLRDPQLFLNAAKYLKKGTGWYVPRTLKKRGRRRTTKIVK